ncbi:MAG: hypothetical protein ABI602_00890 [Candidatus Saccharibacteria bacterium]
MVLSKESITNLLTHLKQPPAVTIYLPTHRTASRLHLAEDRIRCKNLFRRASDILVQQGDGGPLVSELATQLERLLEDQTFWSKTTEGLLLCAAPGLLQMFYLPIDTEAYVAVDETFHLAPIFSLVNDLPDYYVLVVSQRAPALYRGSARELVPAKPLLPASLAAALQIDELSPGEQQRSAAGSGAAGATYNGRGGAKDIAAAERRQFWRLLDNLIMAKADSALPLLLAGTDSEVAEYRAASRYVYLLTASVAGSYGGAPPRAFASEAAQIIRLEVVEPPHSRAIADYQRLKGESPGRAIRGLPAVREAAKGGRIGSLLVSMLRQTTDTVRDNIGAVPVLSFSGHQAAIHPIAQLVWETNGRVVNIEQSIMPEVARSAAAILRY